MKSGTAAGSSRKTGPHSRTEPTDEQSNAANMSADDSATGCKKKKVRTKKGKDKNANNNQQNWKIGDIVVARFSEDGEYYQARIVSMDENSDSCVVCYIGYENEEPQKISSLRLLNTEGSELDSANEAPMTSHEQGTAASWIFPDTFAGAPANRSQRQNPLLPPPPPPGYFDTHVRVPSEQAALSSMLMAWYMSGYHTGYYEAMRAMEKAPGNARQSKK